MEGHSSDDSGDRPGRSNQPEYQALDIKDPGVRRFLEELTKVCEAYEKREGKNAYCYWSRSPEERARDRARWFWSSSSELKEEESVSRITLDKSKKSTEQSSTSEGTSGTEQPSTSQSPFAVSEKYIDMPERKPPSLETFSQGQRDDTEDTQRPSTPTLLSERSPIPNIHFWTTAGAGAEAELQKALVNYIYQFELEIAGESASTYTSKLIPEASMKLIADEAEAQRLAEESPAVDDAPQPSSSGESDDDSSQSSPSKMPTGEDDDEKEFKLWDTKMYLSSLPVEELREIEPLKTHATNVFRAMKAGRTPFSMFIDLFEDIIVNHRIMFESIKASDAERAARDADLKRMSKMNYAKMQEVERELKGYISKDLNQFCYGALEYIRATVHELDVLNHAVYRNQGLTSISNKRKAERIRVRLEECRKRNKSKSIRMKKNVVHVLSHYLDSLENQRLRRNFYKPFFENYKLLRESMQDLRRKYMPEGVVFSLDELTAPPSEQISIDRELSAIVTTQMLSVYLLATVQNQCVPIDISMISDYVEAFIAMEHNAEDNFLLLLRQFVENIPSPGLRESERDSKEVQALKNTLFRCCRDFVKVLEKIGTFDFLIKTTLSILAKTLDFLHCLDLFTKKFIANEQASRQRIMNRPQQVEFNRRFDQYVAEIKNLVLGLQEYVYRKIISLQIKLRRIKNPNYGGAYNAFVDLCRMRVDKLDCVNTNRMKYNSAGYNALAEKTPADDWRVKRAEIIEFLRLPFEYTGRTPLNDLPEAERQFVQRQGEMYLDRTYRQAAAELLSLCASIDSLGVEYQVKIHEIMSYVCPRFDDDAGVAAAAAAVVENVADSATVVLDVADARRSRRFRRSRRSHS